MLYLILNLSIVIYFVHCSSITPILLSSIAGSPFIREHAVFFDVVICFGVFENGKIAKELSQKGLFFKINSECSQDILNSYPARAEAIAYILDLKCPCARNLLQFAEENNLFNRPFRWVLINMTKHQESVQVIEEVPHKHDKLDDLAPWVRKYGFHIDTRCLYVTPDYRVLELFRTGPKEPLQHSLRAIWENDILRWIPHDKYKLRMNVQKALIRSATVVTNNDTYKRLRGNFIINKHIDSITKTNYFIFKHVAEGLNASYSMAYIDTWGFERPNGQWTGLSGYLQRKEIDLAACSLFVLKGRLNFTDFIAFTTPSMTLLHFRLPPLSFVNNIYILPFSVIVWICSIGILVLSGFLWRLTLQFDTPLFLDDRVTWTDIVLGIIGAVCQQGSERESRNISGRIIYLMMLLAIMFLYTSYSASIVALLQSKSHSIGTLKDIYESGIGIGAENISYNLQYLSKANDTFSKLIWENRLDPKKYKGKFMTAEEGIHKMRNQFFAFQMEASNAYQVIQETFEEEEKCGLSGVSYLKERDPYVGSTLGTPYADQFRVLFRKIKETGLQKCIYKRFYMSKPQCIGTVSSYVSVGIIDFYPAILILIIGLGMSWAIFILEIISAKYIPKLKNRFK